jgi:hypothetical protein
MTQITFTEAGLSLNYVSTRPVDDLDQTVHDLAELRECISTLRSWEDVLTEWLSDALGRNGIEVEGVGHVEIKRGTDRKEWDKVPLLRMVLDSRRRIGDDGELDIRDTGNALVGGEELSCSPDLSRVLDVFNLPAPRVTALKDRGIDPDEFCASSPGKITVVIS